MELLAALEEGIRWPAPGSAFWEAPPRAEPLPVAPPPSLARSQDQRKLHVVHVTAEMAPIAKVRGGLSKYTTCFCLWGQCTPACTLSCFLADHHALFWLCLLQVGGLGDVVTGLAKATLARGHNVEVRARPRLCLHSFLFCGSAAALPWAEKGMVARRRLWAGRGGGNQWERSRFF